MNRLRRWLFNLWLDHWYLPRHPHHGMVIPLRVLYRMIQGNVLTALKACTPEMEWFRQLQSEDITPSGQENRIPLHWGTP